MPDNPVQHADYERTHYYGDSCLGGHGELAHIERIEVLEDAIRMMCTEMPVDWPDLARAEGWGHVADLVQRLIDGTGA